MTILIFNNYVILLYEFHFQLNFILLSNVRHYRITFPLFLMGEMRSETDHLSLMNCVRIYRVVIVLVIKIKKKKNEPLCAWEWTQFYYKNPIDSLF